MPRVAALLVVFALAGPSLLRVACEWTCARASASVALDATATCHDDGVPPQDGPSLSVGVDCHDLAVDAGVGLPRITSGTSAPGPIRIADVSHAGAAPDRPGASTGSVNLHSPPPAHVPLRI